VQAQQAAWSVAVLFSRLRRIFEPLVHTPLHPQWLVLRENVATRRAIVDIAQGCVVDIGCGDRWLADPINAHGSYIGLDYPPTVAQGYPGNPDVFGDAARLPFGAGTVDVVLLLDVLEHLRSPHDAIHEAARVLKTGGCLVLQVPFMYPVHDAPNDFQRWTRDGLCLLLERNGFRLTSETAYGHPVETAAALGAIALAKSALNILTRRRLAIPLLPLLALAIPLVNLIGWSLGILLPPDTFMPLGYRLTAVKQA
jgi:SAM-dependent methyltransferase